MNVLILACLSSATGNNSTAERIRNHLLCNNINATSKCVNTNELELKEFILRNEISALIGIHAYRAGLFLKDCTLPYAIVFGGTDLNEHYTNPEKLCVMSAAVKNSRYCIAFNKQLKSKAIKLWPSIEEKIIIQPQAICPCPSKFVIQQDLLFLQNTHKDILNNNLIIFLCVAGLRPVKDPLFLVDVFSEWHKIDRRIHYVIVGPQLDKDYSLLCKQKISRSPGVILMDPMPNDVLTGFMKQVFALVNTSTSEGMANSILEAMKLGTPVFARRNEGNESIIQHRKNGFLFNTPQEFKEIAQEVLTFDSLKEEIIANAKVYIVQHHSLDIERENYNQLVKLLVS